MITWWCWNRPSFLIARRPDDAVVDGVQRAQGHRGGLALTPFGDRPRHSSCLFDEIPRRTKTEEKKLMFSHPNLLGNVQSRVYKCWGRSGWRFCAEGSGRFLLLSDTLQRCVGLCDTVGHHGCPGATKIQAFQVESE